MAAVLEKQAKRWTYDEYFRLDDDQRYEIIEEKGKLTSQVLSGLEFDLTEVQ